MQYKHWIVVLAALTALWLGAAVSASADTVDQVTIDTSAANVGGSSPAEVIFSLTDGNGTGDGNNTITLSDITFGAGATLDPAVDTSNVTGTIDTTVSMADTTFDSSLGILFNPGATVSFLLDFTSNPDSGGTPDSFSFVMFDSNGNLVATSDPTGADTIMNLNLDGSNTSTFADSNYATVTAASVATPESSSLLLLMMGLAGIVGLGMSQRKRAVLPKSRIAE